MSLIDRRIASLPIPLAAQLIGELESEPLALMVLEAEIAGGGTFAQMVGIAARELRVYGTPPDDVLRTIQTSMRLRLAGSVAESRTSLPERLRALRPRT